MMVLVLEKVPVSLRGELTRWLLEPKTGVFVGRVSAQVRDLLWEMVEDKLKHGGGFLIYQSDGEQGFNMRQIGETKRELVDFEGLTLILRPAAEGAEADETRPA
ncbi:MAG: type I-E CRISPR-associated endoribonuclease Cas2e [Thermomicrobiales bacterium]